jgi:2-methylcitrate dehydratase PrpD
MQDPTILCERAKVAVIAEEELERLLPKRVAVVEVTLTDGTKLREQNDIVRGTPENPMNRDEVVAKARDLVTPILGAETCTMLIERIFDLERMPDIRELRPLLQP